VKEVPGENGGGWIFGKRGDGYVALYSDQPYTWTTSGPDADQEVISLGYQNVWICQLGREATDGSFEAFIKAVSEAPLTVDGLQVHFDSPGNGAVDFDWNAGLRVGGRDVPLSGYSRFDNPYTQVAFGSLQQKIEFGGESLVLDFEKGVRSVTGVDR